METQKIIQCLRSAKPKNSYYTETKKGQVQFLQDTLMWEQTVRQFIYMFLADNPDFNGQEFFKNCH